MFTYISLAIIVIVMVFAIAMKLSNANLQQGGSKKKRKAASFAARFKMSVIAKQKKLIKIKKEDDPYAWIRPMIIIDFFRKFWITR
jgi:hypothetical protein